MYTTASKAFNADMGSFISALAGDFSCECARTAVKWSEQGETYATNISGLVSDDQLGGSFGSRKRPVGAD
ncbi:hypothetical protein [Sphingobium sp. YR657]|uniref:hypothetical protein n=1 Tax=Sphingobium sp. YR657 TaxID=1884366 RepID=UPI001114A695|nr:hypothetical protein [Sphingobium sp. YR657]